MLGPGTYPSLWARLMANTEEPQYSNDCWRWTAGKDRWYYGRVNVYVPGLGKVVKLMAHLVAYCWLHANCTGPDEMYLAYIELQASGLELDHVCEDSSCIYPHHTEPVTASENCQRRDRRRRKRKGLDW